MSGPPPKRSGERRRRNKNPEGLETEIVDVDALLVGEVPIPVADPEWEDLTRSFYESFASSGQVIWMEPTDWMTAYTLMEILDRWLKPQEVKVGQVGNENAGHDVTYVFEEKIVAMPAGVISSILKGLSSLMATEASRRLLRIELERRKNLEAALGSDGVVVSIAKNREDVFKREQRG